MVGISVDEFAFDTVIPKNGGVFVDRKATITEWDLDFSEVGNHVLYVGIAIMITGQLYGRTAIIKN